MPFTIPALHDLSFTAAIYALVIRAVVFAKSPQPTIARLARVLFAVLGARRLLAPEAALLSTCVIAAVGSPLTVGFAVGRLAVVCTTERGGLSIITDVAETRALWFLAMTMTLTEALRVIRVYRLSKGYTVSVLACVVFAKGTGIFVIPTIVVLAAMFMAKRQILTVMPRPLSLTTRQCTQVCFLAVNC